MDLTYLSVTVAHHLVLQKWGIISVLEPPGNRECSTGDQTWGLTYIAGLSVSEVSQVGSGIRPKAHACPEPFPTFPDGASSLSFSGWVLSPAFLQSALLCISSTTYPVIPHFLLPQSPARLQAPQVPTVLPLPAQSWMDELWIPTGYGKTYGHMLLSLLVSLLWAAQNPIPRSWGLFVRILPFLKWHTQELTSSTGRGSKKGLPCGLQGGEASHLTRKQQQSRSVPQP